MQRALAEAFKDVRSVAVRRGGDVQPAAETEIAAILKRRLFADVDQAAAEQAGQAYAKLYAETADSLGLSAEDAHDTAERIAATYPFHPALVDVLDKRVGTVPAFQRTRDPGRQAAHRRGHPGRDRRGHDPLPVRGAPGIVGRHVPGQ